MPTATDEPTIGPTISDPTPSPTNPPVTSKPSEMPTSDQPTLFPTFTQPSGSPSKSPETSIPTHFPTSEMPTTKPSDAPSETPCICPEGTAQDMSFDDACICVEDGDGETPCVATYRDYKVYPDLELCTGIQHEDLNFSY